MKKNIGPLLGVAFVVAIISTGVFYGLVVGKVSGSANSSSRSIVVAARDVKGGAVLRAADVKLAPWPAEALPKGSYSSVEQVNGLRVFEPISSNEPVTESRIVSRDKGAGVGIPAGLRAISVSVSDSSGVISMLRPRHKVDVQVIYTRGGQQSNAAELRTVLQNLEVLQVNPQPDSSGRQPLPVVTLLVTPAEADILGLADSTGRVRLLLRNPLDEEKASRARLDQTSLMRDALPVNRLTGPESNADEGMKGRRVRLWVRMAVVGAAGLEELTSRLINPRRADLLQVAAFQPGSGLEKALGRLEQQRQFEIVSASRLLAGHNRQVSVEASNHQDGSEQGCGIRIHFQPAIHSDGRVRLRVRPEVTLPGAQGQARRRIETELDLSDGQSFLVAGLADSQASGSLVERLFPKHSAEARNKELLVLVTPRLEAAQTVALRKQP